MRLLALLLTVTSLAAPIFADTAKWEKEIAAFEQADAAKQKEMEQQLIGNMTSITSLDEDAYIMVATNGLLGEKYLKVVPGGGVNYLKRGDVVSNTQGTMDLEDLISKFITGGAGKSTSSSSTESSASQPATDDAEPSFVE